MFRIANYVGSKLAVAAIAAICASSASAVPITITGQFTSTTPACGAGAVVCSGVGTPAVTWGIPVAGTVLPSSLIFAPTVGLDVSNGDVVSLGTLQFINGTAIPVSWIDGLVLSIDVSGGRAEHLDIAISVGTTVCQGGEPNDVCADYIYFTDATGFGSFRVWEGFYGTVEVNGLFGSLHLAGFGEVTGVGVANVLTGELGPSIPPQFLPPDLQPGFFNPSISAIPEPPSSSLLVAGLAAMSWLRYRKRKMPKGPASNPAWIASGA